MGISSGNDREVTVLRGKRVPMEALMQVISLQLETAGKANLTITGYSMLPLWRQYRDAVQLAPLTGQLKPGDVALYRRDNGRYVVHRIIRLTPEGYLFCGDNQWHLEPVRQDQLVARVCAYTRKGKQHRLSEPGYQLYTWCWVRLFGLRKCYICLRRWMGRLRSRLIKLIKRRNAE